MNDQVPATFDDGSTTKTIPGVGTYTVAPDGTVTLNPEPEFTGTAPSLQWFVKMNGTKASATYTPTVLPVTTFVDKEGKSNSGYPTVDGKENLRRDSRLPLRRDQEITKRRHRACLRKKCRQVTR